MSIIDTIRTANHNLFRNKLRTFLTILAIFIGSFTIILNSAINSGVNNFIDDQIDMIGGKDYIVITKAGAMNSMGGAMMNMGAGTPIEYDENAQAVSFTKNDLAKFESIDGIDASSIDRQDSGTSYTYITSEKTSKKYQGNGLGIMPAGDFTIPMIVGDIPDPETKENLIALESGYPKALGYDKDEDIIGETVTLGIKDEVTGKVKGFKAKVIGVQAPGVVAFNGAAGTKQLVKEVKDEVEKYYPEAKRNTYYAITARFDNSKYTESEIKQILEDNGFEGMTVSDMSGMIHVFFDAMSVILNIFGGIALIAASIGIINTLFMSVEERTREIGLNKALGMSNGRIFAEFSIEAISLGFWGSAVGIILSMIIGNIVNNLTHQPGGILEALPTFNLFNFTIGNILTVMFIVMFIAFLAGTAPAWKAAHKNPIDALRYE